VPASVDEIDVPTAVALRVPNDGGKGGRVDLVGKRGEVFIDPLGGRIRAPVQLVNVPAGIDEIDVLAAVALRVPSEYVDIAEYIYFAGCGRGSAGQFGQVVVLQRHGMFLSDVVEFVGDNCASFRLESCLPTCRDASSRPVWEPLVLVNDANSAQRDVPEAESTMNVACAATRHLSSRLLESTQTISD
jgi:hypothetical protein